MSAMISHELVSIFIASKLKNDMLILVVPSFLKQFIKLVLSKCVSIKNDISIILSYTSKWYFSFKILSELLFELFTNDFLEVAGLSNKEYEWDEVLALFGSIGMLSVGFTFAYSLTTSTNNNLC